MWDKTYADRFDSFGCLKEAQNPQPGFSGKYLQARAGPLSQEAAIILLHPRN
jgi:hypothetical protein